MEYERFFHAGSDPYIARWYLLKASYDLPQRLLCNELFAVRQFPNIPRHGRYIIKNNGVDTAYCYIIMNIFDVAFSDLDNFFALMCDRSMTDPDYGEEPSSFNGNFVSEFTPAQYKRIQDVNMSMNRNTISNEYLRGLESFNGRVNFDINLRTMFCDRMGPSKSSAVINSFKRRIVAEGESSQRKIPPLAPTPGPTTVPPEVCARPEPQGNIPQTVGDEFPSIAPDIDMDEDMNDDTYGALQAIQNENLVNLGQRVLESPIDQFLADDYGKRVEFKYVDNNLYAYFLYRQDQITTTTPNVLVAPDIRAKYEKLIGEKNPRNLSFPTVYTEESERTIRLQLTDNPGEEFSMFNSFVTKYGPEINFIVNSENNTVFEQRIETTGKRIYILLYGLFAYLKNPEMGYTTLMEIIASRYYGRIDLLLLSDTLCRVYFKFNNRHVTDNALTLGHLRRIEIPNVDFESNIKLVEDASVIEAINNEVIPAIKQMQERQKITFSNGRIQSANAFGLNVFAVDDTLTYAFDGVDVYLLVRKYINNQASQTLLNFMQNNDYNIFGEYNYRGLAVK